MTMSLTVPPPIAVPAPERRSRYTACLLGGAIGDALGAPVEFMSRQEILRRFGPAGIRDHASAYGRIGAITDDTQMTLFTAEGLLRAAAQGHPPGHSARVEEVAAAYQRWLLTQDEDPARHADAGGLLGIAALHSRRAPGTTCLAALRQVAARGSREIVAARGRSHNGEPGVDLRANNNSKGCGGVMRVAPAGLLLAGLIADEAQLAREAFALGSDLAALTHGHPSGCLPAGVLAAVIALLVREVPLRDALARTKPVLATRADCEETLAAITAAERLASQGAANHDTLAQLGGGWVGEEALAISLYCALAAPDLESAVVLAVNHAGDSDSTGAITGNLCGAAAGMDALPVRWLEGLELDRTTRELALALCAVG
jgi:ADP-ribosyl-[dinitrogen reductase] hydrolase